MKPLIVPLFPNPENNGLHSVCSLHFVLSTNLYIKDQQDMDIFIFLKKLILVLGNRGSVIKPLKLVTRGSENTYSAFFKF